MKKTLYYIDKVLYFCFTVLFLFLIYLFVITPIFSTSPAKDCVTIGIVVDTFEVAKGTTRFIIAFQADSLTYYGEELVSEHYYNQNCSTWLGKKYTVFYSRINPRRYHHFEIKKE
jgi:hypothetical protein